jgi:putative acetyltransferase
MPDSILIRRERPDQPEVRAALAALDDYLAALYPPEANHILALEQLLAPEVSFFVARDAAAAHRLVGTAAVRSMPGEPATGQFAYGEVKRMYVDPARRGQRLGARLLAAVEDEARAAGLALALLETGRDQFEAVRLYERRGYARRGPFGGYPDNGLSLFLEKRLDATP